MFDNNFYGCLRHKAFNPKDSAGRKWPSNSVFVDDDLDFETADPFCQDISKILNCKALRRLERKTQVFPIPRDPHVRNRRTHTDEVVAIALVLADVLGLNRSLTQAIALGHDLGHTPFGHFGEHYISEMTGRSMTHAQLSVVVCQKVERRGHGLNLCKETLQGILQHSNTIGSNVKVLPSLIQEYAVVLWADKIAYTFADWNDYIRHVGPRVPPPQIMVEFGLYQRDRVKTCMLALCEESAKCGYVSFSDSPIARDFAELRRWMLKNVYEWITFESERLIFNKLIDYFQKETFFKEWDPFLLLALMTDPEVKFFGQIWDPMCRPEINYIKHFGIVELVNHVDDPKIDMFDIDLDWIGYRS